MAKGHKTTWTSIKKSAENGIHDTLPILAAYIILMGFGVLMSSGYPYFVYLWASSSLQALCGTLPYPCAAGKSCNSIADVFVNTRHLFTDCRAGALWKYRQSKTVSHFSLMKRLTPLYAANHM